MSYIAASLAVRGKWRFACKMSNEEIIEFYLNEIKEIY